MTNHYRRQQLRIERYRSIINKTLEEVGQRLEQLATGLPDDIDSERLNEQQVKAISAIDAIESEWVLDPLKREKYSVIQWGDDDNENDDNGSHC